MKRPTLNHKPAGTPQLNAALARARGEFPEIPRNRVATIRMKNGNQYSYKYADLADMIKATTPALSAWGVAIMQWPEGDHICTFVGHESGEERVVSWPIKPMPQRTIDNAQDFQSAVQVAKRYAMGAALGVSTEETIEGDGKAHKVVHSNQKDADPFFEDDGIRAPHGAKVSAKMTKREMAEESARAIEAQLDGVKTPEGLNGVWNRNARFIDVFKDNYDDLFQNIFDKFHRLMEEFKGEAA